jgi:hypothetical protein
MENCMKIILGFCLLAAAAVANAQHKPYAGQEGRDMKALSAQEIEQYRAGAGMGYAKAAELNHYPGPMHVLELADKLGLSEEQRAATRRLMQSHKRDARAIGRKLVEAERTLERLFRAGAPTAGALADAVREAAKLEGEYRLSHLETHRFMRTLLSEAQVADYDRLRGYARPDAQPAHKH